MAASIIKNPNQAFTTLINFANNPTTYLSSGRLVIIKLGRVVILRFIDIWVQNSPTGNEIFFSGIPKALNDVSGVLVSTTSSYGSQKIVINDNAVHNYYSTDSMRNGQSVSGELVYFSKE